MPAVPGIGLMAGSTIRKVLALAGIKDVMSKSFGTNNKLNNTKAAFEALKLLKSTPMMERRAAKKALLIKKPVAQQSTPGGAAVVTPATTAAKAPAPTAPAQTPAPKVEAPKAKDETIKQ